MIHVRDLLFRYWDLDRRQRYRIMKELGAEIVDDEERKSLVELAKLNKLEELDEKVNQCSISTLSSSTAVSYSQLSA